LALPAHCGADRAIRNALSQPLQAFKSDLDFPALAGGFS
jgi:hypothetical protein